MPLFSARGDDLTARIDGDSLPEFEAVKILKQVLEGLKFMHDKGYMHLDLKVRKTLAPFSTGEVYKVLALLTFFTFSIKQKAPKFVNFHKIHLTTCHVSC